MNSMIKPQFSNQSKFDREQSFKIRKAVLGSYLSTTTRNRILALIDLELNKEDKVESWEYDMIAKKKVNEIRRAINEMPRPLLTLNVFMVLLANLEQDTGRVTLTREQIAGEVDASLNNVSSVMTELEKYNIIIKDRIRVEGMRGRGIVQYWINPNAAWNGRLDIRSFAAYEAGDIKLPENKPNHLRVIEGGKKD